MSDTADICDYDEEKDGSFTIGANGYFASPRRKDFDDPVLTQSVVL